MGRSFVVTRGRVTERGQKRRTVSRSFQVGPNAIKFISMTIVAILAVVYLSQSTAGASQGVKIREIESSKDSLTLQQERLQAEQTRLRALKEVDNNTEKQVMEPVTTVDHLSSTGN